MFDWIFKCFDSNLKRKQSCKRSRVMEERKYLRTIKCEVCNKNLALYISQNTTSNGCFQINFSLSNSEGNILYQSNGSSCALLSSAIKNAIAEISAYPYKYNPKFNIA